MKIEKLRDPHSTVDFSVKMQLVTNESKVNNTREKKIGMTGYDRFVESIRLVASE